MLFDGLDASIFMLTLYPCLCELQNTSSHKVVGSTGSIIMATFMFGWAIGAVTFGILADKWGRTKTLTVTVLIYGIFTGLCAFSNSWQELAIWRFFVGCGIGAEASIGGVLIAESLSKSSFRLKAAGILQTGFPLGVLLLGALNLAFGHLGWRFLYLIGIAPAFLAVYFRFFLKEPIETVSMREALVSIEAKPKHQRSAEENKRLKHPLTKLFQRTNTHAILLVVTLAATASIGTYGVLAWIPAWINQIVGNAAIAERSWAMIAQNIGALVAAMVGAQVVQRIGRASAFRLSFIAALATCLSLFLCHQSFSWLLVFHIGLAGFFVCSAWTYLFIYVPELFDTEIRATAFSFSIQSSRILAGFSALLGGSLVAAFSGKYALAAAAISLVYFAGIIATFFMIKTTGLIQSKALPVEPEREPAWV